MFGCLFSIAYEICTFLRVLQFSRTLAFGSLPPLGISLPARVLSYRCYLGIAMFTKHCTPLVVNSNLFYPIDWWEFANHGFRIQKKTRSGSHSGRLLSSLVIVYHWNNDGIRVRGSRLQHTCGKYIHSVCGKPSVWSSFWRRNSRKGFSVRYMCILQWPGQWIVLSIPYIGFTPFNRFMYDYFESRVLLAHYYTLSHFDETLSAACNLHSCKQNPLAGSNGRSQWL